MNPLFFGQNFVPAAGGPAQIAADNFDSYANNALLQSQAGWSLLAGSIKINKPAAVGDAVTNSGPTSCVRRTDTYAEDQYAEVTMTNVATSATGIGPAVACQSGGAFTFYGCYYFPSPAGSESIYLLKYIANTKTDLANSGFGTVKLLTGDVLRLERAGTGTATRLTVKRNGTAITGLISINPNATYIAGGFAGIWGDGNPSAVSAASWAGGNL